MFIHSFCSDKPSCSKDYDGEAVMFQGFLGVVVHEAGCRYSYIHMRSTTGTALISMISPTRDPTDSSTAAYRK